jgi:hypothetical protein
MIRKVLPFSFVMAALAALFALSGSCYAAPLPFSTVFKGVDKFEALKLRADAGGWKSLPIGERTAIVGRALVGTPYKSFTLEIDDKIEAASVNLNGLDCWTFFETSLAFARMLDEPREAWTPETMLRFIELDRYRNGKCTGEYLSRLHYLEDWASDNARRGLIDDITKTLGGVRAAHEAREMTVGWKSYRYLRNTPSLLPELRRMELRVSKMPMYHVPKRDVPSIERKLRNGDIIGITSYDRGKISTSHVGLAYRSDDGVLRFMHASSPRNYGRVVVDQRLSSYLREFSGHAGIIVARPLK